MIRTPISSRTEKFLLLGLTLLALGLRLWRLESVPPGWRDDELIESLVISQKVLDGDLAVYYADASGHEALYHVLNAVMMALFGPTVAGIRWLSVGLGTAAVPLTYLLGKRLWPPGQEGVAGVAGLLLAVSFWSLMYSRFGVRHILLPVLVLAALLFFWRLMTVEMASVSRGYLAGTAVLSALFLALGFYAYFAGRGTPLVLLAFLGYVAVLDWPRLRQRWPYLALLLGLTLLLALPLLLTLQQQPEAEGRVKELAAPLLAAGQGDFSLLAAHMRITLSMFHADGDDEWLYNIPHRPVFGVVGAIFFWGGVLLAVGYALRPFWQGVWQRRRPTADAQSLSSAFLLLWWFIGITPGFLSVPPASLGHTLLAQPAVFLLAALPLTAVGLGRWESRTGRWGVALLALLLVGSMAGRDLPDYFGNWGERGMVRFLYRADIRELADYVNETSELTDFGVAGLLAGPWDRLALEIDLEPERQTAVSARWYNPARAILLQPAISFYTDFAGPSPYGEWYALGDVSVGAFRLAGVTQRVDTGEAVCFVNGLCLVTAVYRPVAQVLEVGWWVSRELDLPDMPLISNPPPPGVYAGPRLAVFGQLWAGDGRFLAGDDGLWVDPTTLRPGDIFLQQHQPVLPAGERPEVMAVGLYDPMTGERVLTVDGRDLVQLRITD